MDKMKKYFIYIITLVVFALFTEFLIAVALNSNYKYISCASEKLENVEIYQSEATKVNGRIRGIIKNSEDNKIDKNYLKIDYFSARDVNMGCSYVEIDKEKEEIPFEVFFKLENVSYYKLSFVNQKDSKGEIDFIPKDLTKPEILIGTALAMLFFW